MKALVLICISLFPSIFGELNNLLEESETSESPLSVQLTKQSVLRFEKFQNSGSERRDDSTEKENPADSETVHLLIHDDFKEFLKTMPVTTLRKLKNLTLSDPQAGHQFLLKLAQKRREQTRDNCEEGLWNCDVKFVSRPTATAAPVEESQLNRPTDAFLDVNPTGLDFHDIDFQDPYPVPSSQQDSNKLRKFRLRLQNQRPGGLFPVSPISQHGFQPSQPYQPPRSSTRDRFPFMYNSFEDEPGTDIEAFENNYRNFVKPKPQQPKFPSNIKNYAQGSRGTYSWTIEPTTLEKVHSETYIPPTAIFDAIAQAEQEDLESQQTNMRRYPQTYNANDLKQQANENVKAQSPKEQLIRNKSTANFVPSRYVSYSGKEPSKGFNRPNFVQSFKSPFNPYASSSSSNYYSDHGGGGYNSDTSAYTSGPWPGALDLGNDYGGTVTNGNYFGQIMGWMNKAQSYFGIPSQSFGSYNNFAATRKILELSIGFLAFLAFGGYVAVLLFRALLPTFQAPPTFVNTTSLVSTTNLMSTLFGRSLDEMHREFVLEQPGLTDLERIVSTALTEGYLKHLKSSDGD